MSLYPKEEAVLKLIGEDPAYENYFFKKVSDVKWFEPLKEKGYFVPQKAPLPKPADQEGYFVIPEWNVLPYLERISQQVTVPGNEKFIDDLLTIIKDVSVYRDAEDHHIDNFRTWYYFTKILINLPTEKVTEEIIDLIPIWLDSRFSTSLQGADIVGKLLPKFLNSARPEDWKKAERLIEIITDIKWVPVSKEQRILDDRDIEARTLIEPYWLRQGFEKNIGRIGEVCSIRVVEKLAGKILSVLCNKYDHPYDIDYENKKYQIAHRLLENGTHEISLYLLKYPENWDSFSSSNKEKTLVTNITISDFESQTAFVAKVKEDLIKDVFPALSSELDEAISAIYSLRDYTYISYNSLNASPDDIRVDDTENILIYAIKEILAVKAQHDKEATCGVLDKFLSSEYPYPFFKRLVLFIAGKGWDNYKEYFFKIVDNEEITVFDSSEYEADLKSVLKNNLNKLTPDQKETIKNVIEDGPLHLPEKDIERYKAYWRQKWLSLMKDDPVFAQLYEEQKKVTGIEKDKFSFGSEIKVSSGFGASPLSVEEILKLPIPELVTKLKEFRSEKKWEGMTVAEFSNVLMAAVKENPGKFIDNLGSFGEVGFIYIYRILDGLKDTWKAKKSIDWGKTLEFIDKFIKNGQFWDDEYIVEKDGFLGEADHKWIVGMIAELIQEGTQDDAWAFSEDHFEKAREIILTLLREPEESEDITDYVSYTLNTSCGKLITALVYLVLRIARVNDKKGSRTVPRWTDEYKGKFDEILTMKIIEAYVSLGRFLPQLSYIDKEWVKGKSEQVVSEQGTKYWQAFMEGYLSIGKVYDDIYELMRPHYEFGLTYEFQDKRNREYLTHHICVGYLRDHEKLDDTGSLFRKVIDAWDVELIRETISFFWMQRDYLVKATEENEKMKGKIIDFWKYLYERYKDKDEGVLTKEDKNILSGALKLAALLSKIDAESYEWLMLSAPYANEDYNSPFIIEYLDWLKDRGDRSETAKYIGNIYQKMLEKFTPDYDREHIRSIVEFLYAAGNKDSADQICNNYGRNQNEMLRDIYERNRRE